MRRFLAPIITLLAACSLPTAALADPPAPSWTLTIPADTTITYGIVGPQFLGNHTVTVGEDWDLDPGRLVVWWGDGGSFTHATPSILTEIPYTLSSDGIGGIPNPDEAWSFSSPGDSGTSPLYMVVTQEAWDNAVPGEYSTTITYISYLPFS